MQYLDKIGLIKLWNNIKTKLSDKLDKTSVKTTETSSETDTYSCNYIDNKIVNSMSEYETVSNYTGFVQMFAGSTAPKGWLICDGSAVSRTTYADLFAVIGTSYGSGDGSTTFNIPNLKGKIPVGLNSNDTDFNTLGKTGGEKEHTLTIDEMPSHKHGVGYVGGNANGNHAGMPGTSAEPNSYNNELFINSKGGDQPHNNMQPYVVMNYIIKC